VSTDGTHVTDNRGGDDGRDRAPGGRRRLLLMRHAKAEQEAATDHARRLSGRGVRDAHAAGVLLGDRGDVPQLVLVSTAQRTRDTWSGVRAGLSDSAPEPEAWFDRSLYDEGPRAVVELLGAVEDTVSAVLVIGHNPTISMVAAALSDGEADPLLEQAVVRGLPTAALACFDVAVSWPDLNAGRLRLTHVDKPRG
jgi:phosphohistidine phosphatase